MNTTEAKGTWEELKGKLKQRFAVLTDNDLMFEEGKKEEMYGKLQITLGKTQSELQEIIAALTTYDNHLKDTVWPTGRMVFFNYQTTIKTIK